MPTSPARKFLRVIFARFLSATRQDSEPLWPCTHALATATNTCSTQLLFWGRT